MHTVVSCAGGKKGECPIGSIDMCPYQVLEYVDSSNHRKLASCSRLRFFRRVRFDAHFDNSIVYNYLLGKLDCQLLCGVLYSTMKISTRE